VPRFENMPGPASPTSKGPASTSPASTSPASGSTDHVELRPGAYADSVRLLQVSRDVQAVAGVVTAQVAMATPLNVEVLAGMGFAVPAEATPNDLVVAIRTQRADQTDDVLTAALEATEAALAPARHTNQRRGDEAAPRTTGSALRRTGERTRALPGAGGGDLVLVSLPGEYAAVEAMDALDAGRDVMVFSDNVPVEQEVALKTTAARRGLLVMGPDCGTAVVGGVGLGFVNAVRPGPVGMVAASGTGCQQLLCLLEYAGLGVSNALGVGGRDLSLEVAGVSTTEAMKRLDHDPAVELILVVSKPPAPGVELRVRALADTLETPVELALLGPGQPDLTAVAERVIERLGRPVPTWPVDGRAAEAGRGDLLRGLFVGGTLCDEAMLVASETLGPIRSNIPLQPHLALGADLTAPTHLMIDFGDDALTGGRAHPMIDPTLRLEHLARVAADQRTGVILLDVVLGHGAEPDPAGTLAPALEGVRQPVVVTVVGTALDTQDRDRQVAALVATGAEVYLSNAGATRRAVELLGGGR